MEGDKRDSNFDLNSCYKSTHQLLSRVPSLLDGTHTLGLSVIQVDPLISFEADSSREGHEDKPSSFALPNATVVKHWNEHISIVKIIMTDYLIIRC